MAIHSRDEWYDLTRATNWTPSYVSEEELFPDEMSGSMGIPMENWEVYDEPYKTTFTEYVRVQREKDAGAYSVKAALERAKIIDKSDPGWVTILKQHYGAIALGEYAAVTGEARMSRFSKAPGNRNMAMFGMLDETRHGQIQLFFPHEYCKTDRQFDWAWKAYHQNDWASLAAKHFFDDIITGRDAISVAIMLTFGFETGFTNMQFLGLAADAADAGDYTFANLISSIQTDESRHAQQGGPALEILIANGKKEEAQKKVDMAVWRAWRLFAVLTGPTMDYYTPLEHRTSSFKEFMHEWIVGQFERSLLDLGLDKPWYWDTFMAELDSAHHGYHLGVWYWRPTIWWNPAAGVTPEERSWLEEKYPGWNARWGQCWDVITENLLADKEDLTLPETLPLVCNMNQLPICGIPGEEHWDMKVYTVEKDGRLFHFSNEVDKWVFEQDPQRYEGHMSIVDRFLNGDIEPMNLQGALEYMGMEGVAEIGKDAHGYAWLEKVKANMKMAS